jgi:hypothetical protein
MVDALKMLGAGNANFKPLSPDIEADLLNTRYSFFVNSEIGSDDVVYGNYNADRQQLNQELECGYHPARPFKTFGRACAEVARRSILAGPSNDIYNRAAIFVDLADDYIYNGVGSASVTQWQEGAITEAQVQALNDANNPGLILPRGVSVIGRVLRNSVLRPSYVPAANLSAIDDRTGIFRATGGSYFFNFTFKDNPLIASSHHLVHTHEFCDQQDLIEYYNKIMIIFGLTGAEVINPGETEIVAPTPETPTSAVDTTAGSSPYIFNCSIRSDYGISGALIDGRSVTGFRSMEAANFSIISLQKDYANAFQKYQNGSWVNVSNYQDYLDTNVNDLRYRIGGSFDFATATYQTDYRHFGFKLIGKAFVQEVSEFTISTAIHHWVASGSDADLSACNSAFGGTALLASGFNGIGTATGAFPQDRGFLGIAMKRPLRIASDGTNIKRVTLGQVASVSGYVVNGSTAYIKLATPLTEDAFAQLGVTLSSGHYVWIVNANRSFGPGTVAGQPEISEAIDVRAQLAAVPWTAAEPDRIYVQVNSNNNILSGGMTTEELALNTIYVRRLLDTRSPEEREYSIYVSNTAIVTTRKPEAGFIVRLANRSTLVDQLDPVNGANQLFLVDSSSPVTVDSPVADTAYYKLVIKPGDSTEAHSTSKFYYPGTPIFRNNRVLRAAERINPGTFDESQWVPSYRGAGDSRGISHPRTNIGPKIILDKDTSNDPNSLTLGINLDTDPDLLAQLRASTDYIAVERFLLAIGYSSVSSIMLPQQTEAQRLFDPSASSSPVPSGKLTTRAAWPMEFNKPSIVEAGGTIFRYIGRFNYSKAIPQYQRNPITDQNQIDACLTAVIGGAVYADGSIENGRRLEGDRLIDLASGRDTSIESAGIGGLADPDSQAPPREDRPFVFGDNLTVEGDLTVVGSFDLSSFGDNPSEGLKATEARLGIARLATNAEIANGINGTPVVTNPPAAVQPHQLKIFADALGLMSDTESILYVDGNVQIVNGLAVYSTIPAAVWTDIRANRVVHEINDWSSSLTDPGANTPQAELARKVVFKNINQAFNFIANRNPVKRENITILLYNSSDANSGTDDVASNYYSGTTELFIQRGPSANRSSGVLYGEEHFTGIFVIFNAVLNFSEVFLNCSGTSLQPDRYSTTQPGFIICDDLKITSGCKFKFYTASTRGYGLVFDAGFTTDSPHTITILRTDGANVPAGRQETVDIDLRVNRPDPNQVPTFATSVFQASKFVIITRSTSTSPLQINTFIADVGGISQSNCYFAIASDINIVNNTVPSLGLNSGLSMSLDVSQVTAKQLFAWFFVPTNGLQFWVATMVDFQLNVSPVASAGSIQTAYGLLSSFARITVLAVTRTGGLDNVTNILSRLANAFPAGVVNYDWSLPAGSARDGVFSASADQV